MPDQRSQTEFSHEVTELQKEVAQLRKQFENFNSFPRNFAIAILRGFASAIGATLVFGLAIAFLIQIIRSIDYVPILNNILNSGAIEEIIQKFAQSV